VSGQATAAAALRASGAAAPSRPLTVPPRPRRVSGPARRGLRDRPASSRPHEEAGVALALLRALNRLSRHRALAGRTWIGLVAFALIGIVTLQLGLLKLNASIGRALEHEAVLQRENAALSIENSEMATSGRITSWAARVGMEPVPITSLHFLAVRTRSDVARASAALSTTAHAPSAGSGEAPGTGSSPAASSAVSSASAEQSTAQSATSSTSGEPSSTGSGLPAGESSAASSSPASSSAGADGTPSEGPPAPTAESSSPAAAPAASATSASGSSEGAPGGGTQAGPSG